MTGDWDSLSDEELACQSQAGSLAAFEELVRRFENRIYSFVFQFCRHEADAREITQDTFVRAYRMLAQFDARLSFAPWIFTIARRKCIDRYRARKASTGEIAADEADGNDPATLLEQQEEAQNLWAMARRSLPEAQFQALWFRYVEEMPIAQIATALGKTQTHVKVMLLRARYTLSKKLPSPRRRAEPSVARSRETAVAKEG